MVPRKLLTTVPRRRENESQSKESVFLAERRAYSRHVLDLPLDYSNMDGEQQWGIAADASEGGLLVYLHEVIENGSLLKIEMFSPRGSELNTIKAMAKVVWSDSVVKKVSGMYRYGLAFQAFHRESLDKLKILLKEAPEISTA